MVTYRMAPELWDELEADGWLGINVWGGTAFTKEGYKPLLFRPDHSEIISIERSEFYDLVEMLRGAPDE